MVCIHFPAVTVYILVEAMGKSFEQSLEALQDKLVQCKRMCSTIQSESLIEAYVGER